MWTAMVLAMLLSHASWAQRDKSLTKDFPELSPKERSRIAAKEAEESKKDTSYQQMMQRAEGAFQQMHYEEALSLYEQARALRPYNVYPKVKIEDLRALIAKRNAEASSTPKDTVVTPPPPPVVQQRAQQQPSPPPVIEQPKPIAREEPPPAPAIRTPPAEMKPKPVEQPKRTVDIEKPVKQAQSLPDGITERTFREGNAIVIERTVSEEGHDIVFKRVFHNWGRVYYFKDGLPIVERVWKERFQE